MEINLWRSIICAASCLILLSSCSGDGVSHTTAKGNLGQFSHQNTVSEVAWQWGAPGDDSQVKVFPIPVGLAVMVDGGVIALSGETGSMIWEYRTSGNPIFDRSVSGYVSDNGEYFVLQVQDGGDDEVSPEMIVLDSSTGEFIHQYVLNTSQFPSVFRTGTVMLSDVNDRYWIVPDGKELNAYELGTDELSWSAPLVASCEGLGSIDQLITLNDVVVVGTTCFDPLDTDEQQARFDEGQDFRSDLVGIDPSSGEEIWNFQSDAGVYPADSIERTLTPLESGLVLVEHPYGNVTQIVDPGSGEIAGYEGEEILWVDSEGSSIGILETISGDYRIEDRSGDIKASLSGSEWLTGRSVEGIFQEGLMVGLGGGVLHLVDEAFGDSPSSILGVFEGFEGPVEIYFEESGPSAIDIDDGISVPGAVIVSYSDSEGEIGILGLR